LKKVITVVAAVLALTFGMSTQAQAAADGPTLCITGSCVWFKHDGDRIYVQDTKADGHSAVAQVCAPSSCSYVANYVWNSQGSGTVKSYGYGTQIPEGTSVYYRPCIGEWNGGNSYILECSSGWTHGTA